MYYCAYSSYMSGCNSYMQFTMTQLYYLLEYSLNTKIFSLEYHFRIISIELKLACNGGSFRGNIITKG